MIGCARVVVTSAALNGHIVSLLTKKEPLMNSLHLRWILSAMFLLFASSAHAERIPITLSLKTISDLVPGSNREFDAVAPDTLTLRAERSRFPMDPTVFSELTLPGLEPDSIDRMLNYKHADPPSDTWTITAANADDFGLNWLEFQNALNETKPGESGVALRFFNSAPPDSNPTAFGFDSIQGSLLRAGIQMPGKGALWATDFQLHEIEISLDYYFWHDVLEGLRGVQIQAEVRGEARVVPEPAVRVLLPLGVFLLVPFARARNGEMPSGAQMR
jgi:hypothetical protein